MAWTLGALVIAAAALIVACRQARAGAARTEQASVDLDARQEQRPSIATSNVRLFAQDVPVGSLPLSLSVETMGGVSTALIPRGTALPTVRRETFSTATDNQASIEVHVVVGDRTLAADNVTVGKFSIIDLPAAPRGVPKVEVSFGVDDQGVVRFSAWSGLYIRPTGFTSLITIEW